MEVRTILSVAIFLIINTYIANALDLDGLDPQQQKIVEKYESVAKLSYGDKCNADLESKGNKVRENLKPFLKKLFTSAFEYGLFGKEGEFELSASLEDAQTELFAEIEEFTSKVEKSGSIGICNDTKTLYCDEEIGECRCGKTKALKGFSFTHVDGHCKFDLGSGCVQSEFADLTTLGCRKGSTCVTPIDNLQCTFSNSVIEGIKYPSRFQKLVKTHGYTCLCDKSA